MFKHRVRICFFGVLLSLLLAVGPVQAVEEPSDLRRVEAYFMELKTAKARFLQGNPDGSFVEGTLYLSRPGRMRFEYDAPSPLLLVADGRFLIHVDRELEQVSHIPLSATPAAVLLRQQPEFEGADFRVVSLRRAAGLLHLEVEQVETPEAGRVILTFADSPLELRQWTVVDAQQLRTTVTLQGLEKGVPLDPALFRFANPWAADRFRKN